MFNLVTLGSDVMLGFEFEDYGFKILLIFCVPQNIILV